MKKPLKSILRSNRLHLFVSLLLIAAAFVVAAWRIDAQRVVDQTSSASVRSSESPAAKQDRFWADGESNAILVTDLSTVPQGRPEAGVLIYAYDSDPDGEYSLVRFDASTPGTYITKIPLSGLDTANHEFIGGMDFRPADGLLYGVATRGFSPFLRDRVVTINLNTGVVTSVHPTNNFPAIIDSFWGIDFDPVSDRFRNVGFSRTNRRLNPNDGTLSGNDTALAYVAGDPNAGVTPNVVHAAYTMSTSGPAITTLYGIDSATNSLVRIGGPDGNPSPNTGQLTTIGPLGFDTASFGGMDIQQGTGTAYAALNISSVATLVTINLTTGAATIIGPIGSSEPTSHRVDGLSLPVALTVVPPTPSPTPFVTPSPSPIPTPTTSPTPGPIPSPTATPSPTPAGTPTPTPPRTPTPTPTPTRTIRAVSSAPPFGGSVTVPFSLVALEGESSASFTVTFPRATLSNPVPGLGPDVPSGTTLQTDLSQVAAGRIGISVNANGTYAPGTHRILTITFNLSPNAVAGTYPIGFDSVPTAQSVTTLGGSVLTTTYEPGNVVLGITAAGVEVSGRVLTADGRGLRNTVVSITDSSGVKQTATTSSFGYYRFEDVEVGKAYVIAVESKRYRFASRLVNVVDTLTDVDLWGS